MTSVCEPPLPLRQCAPLARPLLKVDALATAYGASQVLFGISFTIRRGAVIQRPMGGLGAGKREVSDGRLQAGVFRPDV